MEACHSLRQPWISLGATPCPSHRRDDRRRARVIQIMMMCVYVCVRMYTCVCAYTYLCVCVCMP
jgi:hypothetical protein